MQVNANQILIVEWPALRIQEQQPFSVSLPVSLQKFLQVIRQLF